MSDREEFEKKFPVPENVEFSAKLNKYVWENFPAFTARFNDTWEAFCDGYQTAIESREDGFVRVPVETIEISLTAVRSVLERAYNSAEPRCCNRLGYECCGSPEPEWSEYDQWIMSDLSPIERSLSSMLNAAKEAK